jgi:hypothetical protein
MNDEGVLPVNEKTKGKIAFDKHTYYEKNYLHIVNGNAVHSQLIACSKPC